MVSRRGFLFGASALAAATLADEIIPFGRVWFFPQKIRLANLAEVEEIATWKDTFSIVSNDLPHPLNVSLITLESLKILQEELVFTPEQIDSAEWEAERTFNLASPPAYR
jgi:hypothetical protein